MRPDAPSRRRTPRVPWTTGRLRHWRATPVARRAARHRLGAWLVAAVVAVTVHHLVDGARDRARAWGDTVVVAVTTGPVGAGTELRGHVTRRRLPEAVVPAGSLPTVPDGRRAARDLAAGSVLTGLDTAPAGRGPVAAVLGPGRAAVEVPIDAAPAVAPGDRVDVVAPTVDPLVGTAGGERPLNGTASGERPLNGTASGERPLNGTASGERLLAAAADVLAVGDGTVTLSVGASEAAGTAAAALGGPLALVVRP